MLNLHPRFDWHFIGQISGLLRIYDFTKMGADKLAENNPNARKVYLPKLSAQAQKFENFAEKKTSLGVRSPWSESKFVPTTSRSFYMHSKSLYAVFCHLSYFSVTIYIFILYSKLAWLCSILARICMSDDSGILFLFFPLKKIERFSLYV